MKPIRTIYPDIIFWVNCEDSEIQEATDLANSIATKLLEKNSHNPQYRPASVKFINLQLMKQYDSVI